MLDIFFLLAFGLRIDIKADLIASNGGFGPTLIKLILVKIMMIPEDIRLHVLDSISIKDLYLFFGFIVFI